MDENELQKEFIDKGLTAPRITPADIDRAIVAEAYYVFPGTTLTVVDASPRRVRMVRVQRTPRAREA